MVVIKKEFVIIFTSIIVLFNCCSNKYKIKPCSFDNFIVDTIGNDVLYTINEQPFAIHKTLSSELGVILNFNEKYFDDKPFFVYKKKSLNNQNIQKDVYAKAIDSTNYLKLKITFNFDKFMKSELIRVKVNTNPKSFNDEVKVNLLSEKETYNILNSWDLVVLPLSSSFATE